MATAAVVMVVVIIVVGAGAYVAFRSVGTATSTSQSCAPANSPGCGKYSTLHDLGLLSPFKSAQAGTPVPVTITHSASELPTKYNFDFGDGSTLLANSPTADHTYASPGIYIISGQALIGGTWHDTSLALASLTISATYQTAAGGELPGLIGVVTANTTSNTAATAVISAGQSVSVLGSYSSAPTNPAWTAQPPTLSVSGSLTVTGQTLTATSAAGTVTFPNNGTYQITFHGSAVSGATTQVQSFLWTVYVGATGVPLALQAGAGGRSPHPGQIVYYFYAPGGGTSEDPAIDYETVGYEVILNVYETLIAYNGSQSGPTYQSYVPVIATCVPGSPQCGALYPGTNNLVTNGQFYTFVVSKSAHFYDPYSGSSWGVYPTDVLFSVARTLGFSNLPCVGCNNGWILAQSLLPAGNGKWDGGIHSPYNNTPQGVFNQILVNNSTYCPAAAMSSEHGCVTFNVNGLGKPWPYFLELIADNLGASVVPCGWYSASSQGQAIPGWTSGAFSGAGDQPCTLPGGATSSDSAAFKTAVAAMSPKLWDTWEFDYSGAATGSWPGNTQYRMVGSGPFYLAGYQVGQSYALADNPAYLANPNCLYKGCYPQPGAYAKTVSTTWESTATPGESAYASGVADFASIPVTDVALLLQLVQNGRISALSFPTISIFFFPFDLNFNIAGAKQYDTNPITVPSDFMSSVGMRQFLVHSFPYQSIQQTISTKDGIQFFFNYGGAIPQFMANYYPASINWPSGDPSTSTTTVGTAGWWWSQINTPSSTYYDPELASCSTASPCEFPFFGQTGAPDLDQRLALFAGEIGTLSGGKLKMDVLDINFIDLVLNSLFSSPGKNSMPWFQLGWAPDYPDPTDYVIPLYYPDATYTFGDAVAEQLGLAAFNATGCSTDFAYYAALTTPLAPSCQGAAYQAMINALSLAAVTAAGPARVTLYTQAETIANELALYVYWGQQNGVATYAAWINGNTLNNNVTIGGGGDETWFQVGGNGVWG